LGTDETAVLADKSGQNYTGVSMKGRFLIHRRSKAVVTQPIALLLSALDGWSVEGSLLLLAAALVAGMGTGILFVVSVVAYRRRQGAQYQLIAVAVSMLLFRSILGTGTILGIVPMPVHHFLGHSLDFLIAAIILYTVYTHAPGSVGNDTVSD
jgi:uncharacterized membrane protein